MKIVKLSKAFLAQKKTSESITRIEPTTPVITDQMLYPGAILPHRGNGLSNLIVVDGTLGICPASCKARYSDVCLVCFLFQLKGFCITNTCQRLKNYPILSREKIKLDSSQAGSPLGKYHL